MTVAELCAALADYPDHTAVMLPIETADGQRGFSPCVEVAAGPGRGAICLYPSGTIAPTLPEFPLGARVYISGGAWGGQEGTVAYSKFSGPHGEARRWRYEITRRGYKGCITVDEQQLERLRDTP